MTKTSKIDIGLFWDLLRDSGLLPPAELSQIQERFLANSGDQADSELAANWLVKQKILTDLHTEVLLNGFAGPFDFGRYRILRKTTRSQVWLARDRKTKHSVWLHFSNGDSREDLAKWDRVEYRSETASKLNSTHFVRIYECVVTRSHRFVSTAVPLGSTLAEILPLKAKLKESQALDLTGQISSAIKLLHSSGLRHGDLCLENVYFDSKSSRAQVIFPVLNDSDKVVKSDTTALGEMLFRLSTGRNAPPSEKLAKAGLNKFSETLASRKVSLEVSELIFKALTSGPGSVFDVSRFHQNLVDITGAAKSSSSVSQPNALETTYVTSLVPWRSTRELIDGAVPELASPSKFNETESEQNPLPQKRRSGQWSVGVAMAATLLGFAGLIGVVALVASLKKIKTPQAFAKADPEVVADASLPIGEGIESKPKRLSVEELLKTQSYVQDIISDDQNSLWESPTTGFSIDVSALPPSPRMIASVRWNDILNSTNGALAWEALGPRMDSVRQRFQARLGFPLDDFESTVISWHSNLSFDYEVFAVAKLVAPTSLEICLENWSQPAPIPGLAGTFESSTGVSYWVSEKTEGGGVIGFAVGPTALIQQVASGEVAALSGTLRKLAESSDSDRDVNLLLPVMSLFNTEGQKLFSQQRKWLNELRLTLPSAIRGASISLHFDEGDYIEIRADHTSELKPSEASELLKDRIGQQLEQAWTSLQQTETISFWEPVRARFGAMLRDLDGQLRWDTEFKEVIGNAWLPPGAIHNVISASELAIAFEPRKKWAQADIRKSTPQNLMELLDTKRDLKIANPPDLNVLLRDIAAEISDEYLDLPFEFNIQIAGTDLQLEGITQNQRPGPLQIENQSVAQILTQVMVSANPNREISGPSDANCKLVWVIVDSAETAGGKSVLITTRKAVAQKGYALPEVFRVQP